MIKIPGKHLLVIISVTFIVMIFSGTIDYSNSQYSNADLNKYISMAGASPALDTSVIKPFVYRIAVPWIAGLLPFSISSNFYIINIFSLLALSLSFYYFLTEFGVEKNLVLFITIIFQFNKYFFVFLAWNYFQASDALSLAVLFYSFILIKRRKIIQLLFFMTFSVFIKEYILFIIPSGMFYYYKNSNDRKNLFYFGIISALSVLIFILIRILISSESGESLYVQYTTQLIYYSKPALLLKRFVIPFTPFGLLPLIFYKDLVAFFKTNKEFLIYSITIILLSFFGEPERLMEPLAPVYYLFIAELINKYLLGKSLELEVLKNKNLLYILLSSLIVSIYHLWGRIILPNETYSVVSTIFFTLLVSIVFYRARKFQIKL